MERIKHMNETQKLEEQPAQSEESNIIELPVAAQSTEEEKHPMDLLLDRIDAMEARIAQLEATIASHGHSINIGNETISQIGELAMQKVNALIRARLGRV